MGDESKKRRSSHEEVIAAFDRVRAEAHELQRRHREQVRGSKADDRPARNGRSGNGNGRHSRNGNGRRSGK